jgi:hypothetical protein
MKFFKILKNKLNNKDSFLRQFLLMFISVVLPVILTLYFSNRIDKKNKRENARIAKEKLINDLRKAWASDTHYIDSMIRVANKEIESISRLLDNYTNHFSEFDNQTIDTLVHFVSHSLSFSPQISVFEVNRYNDKLKLLPDTIQQKIFELYDETYRRSFLLVEHQHNFISNKIDLYLLEHAKYIGYSEYSYTIKIDKANLNRLFKDEKFKHYLNYNRTAINLVIDNYNKSLEKIKLLLEAIKEEEKNIK